MHGFEISKNAAAAFATSGLDAGYLDGGIDAWRAACGPTIRKLSDVKIPSVVNSPSVWVTRAWPKIDRIAYPWLIGRFIDPLAEFVYVPADSVLSHAAKIGAIAYDVPKVTFTHAVSGKYGPKYLALGGGHAAKSTSQATNAYFIIGDETLTPPHALFRWQRFAIYTAIRLLLWRGAMALLFAHSGMEGTLAKMGAFFTKATLLTFCETYALITYVYQGAMENYQWLTAAQMIDGLALGETTPGPLIMVAAFVGFAGG